nr:hypothetical protein [Tanacetum cinerariifolium]
MSEKDSIATQTCKLSKEKFNDFLTLYPIPSEYRVILHKSNQTVFNAPPRLNPFGCAKLTTFVVMCKAYGCEPSVDLFRGFFNLCRAGLPDILKLNDATACHLKISAITPPAWKNHLDNHIDVELLDLHDRCYARQAVVDNGVIRRSRLPDILKLNDATSCHLKISAITPPAWKNNLDNHIDVELLDLHDRCYARQAVVDNAVIRRLVSFAILYGRCRAYQQVADMKEPFDLLKLDEFMADPLAPIEALLSKKPQSLQRSAPLRTQVLLPSS